MTGTREDPTPQRNGSAGQLWYRGKYNLDAHLEHMVAAHSLKTFDRIILSGCSAGGMVRSNSTLRLPSRPHRPETSLP